MSKVTAFVIKTLNGLMPALQNRERLRVWAFPDYATKLAFYALRNSALRQKNAQIMLDSQNNATLLAENALFNFKQNVETQVSCVYQQLNEVKSVQLFVIKLLIQSKLVQR